MGQILTEPNLEEYLRKGPWGVADLFYERLPMLTVRNYISCADEAAWPLCWERNLGLQRGLSLCIDFLRAWRAFRPRAATHIT